jgi:cytochrome c-type biogenesis protein
MAGVDWALALSAGMVTAFNPCGVALLPAFLALLLARDGEPGLSWSDGLSAGLAMTTGFVVIFGVAGLLVDLLGRVLFMAAPVISLVTAALLLVLSIRLWRGATLTLNWGRLESQLNAVLGRQSAWPLFFYGLTYGIVSLTCSFPVFLTVAVTGFHQGLLTGVARYGLYALGMGLVVTGLAVVTTTARAAADRLVAAVLPLVPKLSAIVMAAGSFYLLWYWLGGPGGRTGLI